MYVTLWMLLGWLLFVTLKIEIGKPDLLELEHWSFQWCIWALLPDSWWIFTLLQFRKHQYPYPCLLVTSGAIHPTESMVQLSLLLCSITLSIQTLHLFPFLQQTLYLSYILFFLVENYAFAFLTKASSSICLYTHCFQLLSLMLPFNTFSALSFTSFFL